MEFADTIEAVGKAVDVVGVVAMIAGAMISTAAFGNRWRATRDFSASFPAYRRNLGRAILLGLEFLVAGDIIRTVAVSPTFRSLGVLAIIVAIRTFLSFALELEVSGRWPWEKKEDAGAGAGAETVPLKMTRG